MKPRLSPRAALAGAAFLLVPLSLGGCRHDDADARAPQPAATQRPAQPTAVAPSPAAATPAPAEELNVVQREMRQLLAALQGTVAAIADDDLARVPKLIHGVHGARQATDAAIADGSYKPPKNPDQIETFTAMDGAFHDQLVVLVKAARANDLAATTTQLGVVLGQCKGCHAVFRDLPAARQEAPPTDENQEHDAHEGHH